MTVGFDLGLARAATFSISGGGKRLIQMADVGVESPYYLINYNWVDHLGNRIVDDAGNAIVFASPITAQLVDDVGNHIVTDGGDNLILTDNGPAPIYTGTLGTSTGNTVVDDLGNYILLTNY